MATHKVIHICKPHEPTHKPKLAKEYAFSNAPADRQTNGRKEHRTDNMGFAKWRVKCFYDTFVLGSTFGILMNFSAKNPPLRKAQNRYKPF